MKNKLNHQQKTAQLSLSLMDLTSLNDSDTDAVIQTLCHNAQTDFGHTAAVCVYPQFVSLARQQLGLNSPVKIATVTNFPHGHTDVDVAVKETMQAIEYGTNEVDVVFPYQAFLRGDKQIGRELVAACVKTCHEKNILLKVIIESGKLQSESAIRAVSEIAIEEGVDFLKTSTGKVEINATPESARFMLDTIRVSGKKNIGFKAAGGVRTVEEAAIYLLLASEIMGEDWISPSTFRFGASGLLNNLLSCLNGSNHVEKITNY